MAKYFLKKNVHDEALDRIRYLFDEFANIVACFSGGKDSTVILNLCLKVAEEKGRLPLKVLFIDQEAEWQCVIDYVESVMYDKRIEPYWLQVPVRLFNATSHEERWLNCWADGEEWVRERNPIAETENIYGTDRFKGLFDAFNMVHFNGEKSCQIGGVRCEESPARTVGLTTGATYKHITYGRIMNKSHEVYVFYPIYDWTYKDVWKYIHDNGFRYCALYDYQYQNGVPARDMRVSNVHHETALKALEFLQEIEPDNWNALAKRVSGINTVKHMGLNSYSAKELPYMFRDWKEYRDYLLENLIEGETDSGQSIRDIFKKQFDSLDARYPDKKIAEALCKTGITSLIVNDYFMTKLKNVVSSPDVAMYLRWKRGRPVQVRSNKYIIDAIENGGLQDG